MKREINPASVLLFLRGRGATGVDEICRAFDVMPSTSAYGRQSILKSVLDGLCNAGMLKNDGLVFEVTPLLDEVQRGLHLSLGQLSREQQPESDASRGLRASMEVAASTIPASAVYREDLLATIREMRDCLGASCYIAVLCLAGKCLELCLKQRMTTLGVSYDEGWMLGKLLERARSAPGEYFDPALGNIANIINQSRIPAVHAKRSVPVPSMEQAVMVVNAVLDVMNRTLLRQASPTL